MDSYNSLLTNTACLSFRFLSTIEHYSNTVVPCLRVWWEDRPMAPLIEDLHGTKETHATNINIM